MNLSEINLCHEPSSGQASPSPNDSQPNRLLLFGATPRTPAKKTTRTDFMMSHLFQVLRSSSAKPAEADGRFAGLVPAEAEPFAVPGGVIELEGACPGVAMSLPGAAAGVSARLGGTQTRMVDVGVSYMDGWMDGYDTIRYDTTG